MTQGCLFMTFGSIPLLAPHCPFFFQLLSAYYASLVLLGCLYFSSFLIAAITSLLEFSSYLISRIFRWAWYFFTDITSKCWSTENFLWFELDCRNVSGSLGKQEMLWEQEVLSDCFNNFSVFSQTWTTYRNAAFIVRSCSLLALVRYLSYPISNSNWTEWSTIQGVIARVISKSDEREARGRFEITSTITPWIVRHEVQLPINRI